MAKRKLRLTAFARFFIVMLFLAPLAYIGASYYNGEDGLQNFKDLLGIDKQSQTEQIDRTDNRPQKNNESTISYEKLMDANKVLKDSVRSKDQQIYKLKQRIIDLQMNR